MSLIQHGVGLFWANGRLVVSGVGSADIRADAVADTALLIPGAGIVYANGTLLIPGAGLVDQGDVLTSGILAATEARDGYAGTGSVVRILGTLAATERADAFAATGSVFNPAAIVGNLAVTEQRDGYSGAGQVVRTIGSLTVVEARDTGAFAGLNQKQIDGTLATLEGFDVAAFVGEVYDPDARVGNLRVTEARDGYAGTGTVVRTIGTVAATEGRDAAAFTGTARKIIDGTFAVTERPDKAHFTDVIEEDDVGNTIAARDSNYGIGISPEAEWKDGPPSWARGAENGEINFPHAIGQPSETNNFSNSETNRQMRLVQAVSDTQPGQDVVPGWVAYTFVKAGDWAWTLSRTEIVADTDNPIGYDDVSPV